MRKRKKRPSHKKNKGDVINFERCCCEEEAKLSKEEGGLVPKFTPHENNPKWIAFEGIRPTCKELGQRKNYSNKLHFQILKKDFEEFQSKLITKENEEGSFAIPIDKIEEFNEKIINLKSIVLDRKNQRKRRKK